MEPLANNVTRLHPKTPPPGVARGRPALGTGSQPNGRRSVGIVRLQRRNAPGLVLHDTMPAGTTGPCPGP